MSQRDVIKVLLLTVCVVDFNAVCYGRDNSSLPTDCLCC